MTEPLVPADVDLRGTSGFLIDVNRLLASELVALGTPEEKWAAFMLWCRAWQQHPPGSIPPDDRLLAAFSGAGTRWPKVKAMAMRGFILCSDGRLYHPVLCTHVMEAWKSRKAYRNDQERLRKWREKQRGNDDETVDETPRETRFNGVSETPCETLTETQSEPVRREGEGKGRESSKHSKNLDLLEGGTGGDFLLESPPQDAAGKPAAQKKNKRPSRIPDDWTPDGELIWWADELFGNTDEIGEAHDQFMDHWKSNGKPMIDWDAAFRNWCRKRLEFRNHRKGA